MNPNDDSLQGGNGDAMRDVHSDHPVQGVQPPLENAEQVAARNLKLKNSAIEFSSMCVNLFKKHFKNFDVTFQLESHERVSPARLSEEELAPMFKKMDFILNNSDGALVEGPAKEDLGLFGRSIILPLLSKPRDSEDFLNHVNAFYNFRFSFQYWLEVGRAQYDEIPLCILSKVEFFMKVLTQLDDAVLLPLKGRISESILQRFRTLRSEHSLCSQWVWNAFVLEKDFPVFADYFAGHIDDAWGLLNEPYERDMKQQIGDFLRSLPRDFLEVDYLAFLDQILDLEIDITINFENVTGMELFSVEQQLADMLCMEHRRRVEEGWFGTVMDMITLPDHKFEEADVAYLLSMYASSVEHRPLFFEDFGYKLRAFMGRKTDAHVPPLDIEGSPWPIDRFRDLMDEMDNIRKGLHERIDMVMRHDKSPMATGNVNRAKRQICGNVFNHLKNKTLRENIERATSFYARYLCGQIHVDGAFDDTPTIRDRDNLFNFFMFYANQTLFMTEIENFIKERMESGDLPPMIRLTAFLRQPEMEPYLSVEVAHLLRDIADSRRARDSYNNLYSATGPQLGSSILTMKNRYLEYEKNLLIRPESITHLHSRLQERISESRDPMEKVETVNALSFVTVSTNLFGGERETTTLRLTVYQLSVLNILRGREEVGMQEIYNNTIRKDITPDSHEWKQAEHVVGLVLNSLMNPYPLILVRSSRAEFSNRDLVVLNRELVLNEDYVAIPIPDLKLKVEETTTVKTSQPQTKKRNAYKEKVAENVVTGLLRKQERLEKSNIIERVFNKMKIHKIEKEDIKHAIDSLLEKKKLKVAAEGGSDVLEYVPQEDDE